MNEQGQAYKVQYCIPRSFFNFQVKNIQEKDYCKAFLKARHNA